MTDMDRYIAAADAPERVKPLEWAYHEKSDEPNIFGIVCRAETVFPGDGDYIIYDEFAEENTDGELEMVSLVDEDTGGKFYFQGGEYFPTLEAAKAAAQADYEQRILSALAPATPSPDVLPYLIMIGPYRGICVGGRWNNWLFHQHINGHWVSLQKLDCQAFDSALARITDTGEPT